MNFKNKIKYYIMNTIQIISIFLSTLNNVLLREKIHNRLFWACIGCIVFFIIVLLKFAISQTNHGMSIYVVIGLILSLCAVFYILYYIKYYLAVYYKSKLESIIPIVLSLSEISSEILSKTGEIEDNNFEYKKFNESALTNIDNKLNNIMLEILKKDAKIVDYCTDSQIITIWSAMLNDFKNVNKINLDTIDDMKNLTKNYSLYRHIDALLMFIKGKTYDDIENKYKSLNVSRLFKEYIHANADKFSQLYTFLPDIIPLLDRERLKRRKIEKAE